MVLQKVILFWPLSLIRNIIENRLYNKRASISSKELDERTPLFHFLMEQETTFDRALTGPFIREALAIARNEAFLEYCQSVNELETISIYDIIQ